MSKSPYAARRAELTANLIAVFAQATPDDISRGVAWYPAAEAGCRAWADVFALPAETVACVIAACSPQCAWDANLRVALAVLQGESVPHGALPANVRKARKALRKRLTVLDDIMPQGPKVQNFARNLAGDADAVTVDTHAFQAALNDVTTQAIPRPGNYGIIADCYRAAARQVGLRPCDFQAVIWVVWKRLYPWTAKQQLRRSF